MTTKKLPRVSAYSVTLGCDPEVFIAKKTLMGNRITGAEHIIPAQGLKDYSGKVIIDGVAAELNPMESACRANLANYTATCMRMLMNRLPKDMTLDFRPCVKVSKTEMASLSPANRRFGCSPSFNIYNEEDMLATIDSANYPYRGAGGHIHIGVAGLPTLSTCVKESPDRLVRMLDIIVGNTCVLFDTDKTNALRRRTYGRAGEYRLPKHGLEYRVLSNFWLQSRELMSFAFGLTRIVCSMLNSPSANEFYDAFVGAVDINEIRHAINTNNVALARKNYEKIKPLLKQALPDSLLGWSPITTSYFDKLDTIFDIVAEKGLREVFPLSPMDDWRRIVDSHDHGFGAFIERFVVRQAKVA